MQKLIYITIFCLIATSVQAQTPSVEYFMKSSYQKQNINPAFRARQGYVGFPGAGNFSADIKTNTLNLDHLTVKQNGEVLFFTHSDVSANSFLSDMKESNYLNLDVNENILSFGSYSGKKGYLFFDLNVRADVNASIPYSFFEFAKKGIAMNESSYYNFKDVRVQANAFFDIGVGYSYSLMEGKLIVGGKGKVLLGYASADLRINDMTIDAGLDRWIVNSDITLNAYGQTLKANYDDDGKFDDLDYDPKFGFSGFGLGLDLGANFNLGGLSDLFPDSPIADQLERFTFSMAFTDIGFISWNKSHALNMYSELDNTVITGNHSIDINNPDSFDDMIDDITDKLKDITDLREDEQKGRTTSLKTNMNIGLEYEIIKDELSVGVISTNRFAPLHTISEFTLGGSYRPCSWFELGLSYSAGYNNFDKFGLALHFAPKAGVNFFLASDYLIPDVNGEFLPISSKGVNVSFGLSFPLGARR